MSTVSGDSNLTVADARQIGKFLFDEAVRRGFDSSKPFVQATITSPPYGSMIDYGPDDQIGHGQTADEYHRDLRQLFADLYEWTLPSGVLWIVADSYLQPNESRNLPSRLEPLPFRLAQMAEDQGWTLREIIIWHKDRTRPWTHHGKLRNAFEHAILLVKGHDFLFNVDRLRETDSLARWWVQYPERYNPQGKAPDNVWSVPIPPQGSWARKAYQHACPLPIELVRRFIELTTEPGDVVFDPFGGIGTVPAVAGALGRSGIGTELNPTFVTHFDQHVKTEVHDLLRTQYRGQSGGPEPSTIVSLRVLKYPKTLFAAFRRNHPERSLPRSAIVALVGDPAALTVRTRSGDGELTISCLMVMDDGIAIRDETQQLLKDIASRAPLSKFGLAADIRVVDTAEATRLLGPSSLYRAYEHGRTWETSSTGSLDELLGLEVSNRRGRFLPILSTLDVNVDIDAVGDIASEEPDR